MTGIKRRKGVRYVVGLDVGTTKICAIVATVGSKGLEIIALSSGPSKGLRKGVVTDVDAAAEAISRAVAGAEEQAGIPIRDVFVGIAGSHVKSLDSHGAVTVRGRTVTQEDVERAIDAASAVYVPLDREILHVLPTDFILDGRAGIRDPVGLAGDKLEVKVYIVTGSVASVQNLISCCERAQRKVLDIVMQPLASAEATLSADERESGIALVDIGGGTTDIAVYRDGWLRHASVIGIGGNHFTNDLSVGLKITFQEAERIKKEFGSVIRREGKQAGFMNVVSIDGQVQHMERTCVTEILQPRGEELLALIRNDLDRIQEQGFTLSGVVLTGGASLLTGFDRLAEAELSLPVRVGFPGNVPCRGPGREAVAAGRQEVAPMLRIELNSPMYATGIGLVMFGGQMMRSDFPDMASGNLFADVLDKMKGWFQKVTWRG